MWEITTHDPEQTEKVGTELGKLLLPGDLILLLGDLGAGKTVFVHGVARGLDVTTPVSSPSFLIIQEYEGKWPVFHCDFYRLNSYQELEDIGWDEYLRQLGVILIEWGDRFPEALPNEYLAVYFARIEGKDQERRLRFRPSGERYEQMIGVLAAKCGFLV